MGTDRVILHCDCNCFFASVEMAKNPAYAKVPMAVGGDGELRHGIILAKNELAKKYGIQTAETVLSAKRKCPGLVICPPHFAWYEEYSRAVSRILLRYTDLVEPFGMDESWLDVTASQKLFGDGIAIAKDIQKTIFEELNITVSIGVSFNKAFAKLGSDYKKPNAITAISRDNFEQIVFPLPVGTLLFVGKKTESALAHIGIRTIGELAKADSVLLNDMFGKMGDMLISYAKGEDASPVNPVRENAKSVSNGFTFVRDLVGRAECRKGIEFLTEEIGYKLRRDRVTCDTVTLKIKDPSLHTIGKQQKLNVPSNVTRDIVECAWQLLDKMWSADAPVRMLTVGVGGLYPEGGGGQQISFFENHSVQSQKEKNRKRDDVIDDIRQKFGKTSILSASFLQDDDGIFTKKK